MWQSNGNEPKGLREVLEVIRDVLNNVKDIKRAGTCKWHVVPGSSVDGYAQLPLILHCSSGKTWESRTKSVRGNWVCCGLDSPLVNLAWPDAFDILEEAERYHCLHIHMIESGSYVCPQCPKYKYIKKRGGKSLQE